MGGRRELFKFHVKALVKGSFVFYTLDLKVRFTDGNDSYANVTYATTFTYMKHITMFVKIAIFT